MPRTYVRWWEALLILVAATGPVLVWAVAEPWLWGEPSFWELFLGPAGALGLTAVGLVEWRRRRRAAARRRPVADVFG